MDDDDKKDIYMKLDYLLHKIEIIEEYLTQGNPDWTDPMWASAGGAEDERS